MITNFIFDDLYRKVKRSPLSEEERLTYLATFNCILTPEQTISLLRIFGVSKLRIEALKILIRINSTDASMIMNLFTTSQSDKLIALEIIKGHICDINTNIGMMNLLNPLIYENDKRKALVIIKSAQAKVDHVIAAGGHQGFGPVGGLYSQASPLLENLYGSFEEQIESSKPQARPIQHFYQRTYVPMPSQTSFLYNGDKYRSWYPGGKRPTTQLSK